MYNVFALQITRAIPANTRSSQIISANFCNLRSLLEQQFVFTAAVIIASQFCCVAYAKDDAHPHLSSPRLIGSVSKPSRVSPNDPPTGPSSDPQSNLQSNPSPQLPQQPSNGPAISLPQLEQLALHNNPTLPQASAAARSAEGMAKQAGLLPNPVVGYQSEEYAFRALDAKPEYFGFFEQTLPLGSKLAKSKNIYLKQAAQARVEMSAQQQRIINTVRALFYQTLGAQQQVELHTQLAKIAHDATNTTSDLFNVGQADKPDFLQSEIETEQVEHELQEAKNNLKAGWKLLASVVGIPEMTPVRLVGKLDDQIPAFDEEQLLSKLLHDSPQIKSAEAQVAKSRAVLIRAKAEPIPDMYLRGGIGYSSEFLDTSTNSTGPLPRTGVEANMQVGMSLPVWNRNQGGIAAARADLVFAENELRRLRLALRVQFAREIKNYNNALDAVRRYRDVMLPKADQANKLYLSKYKQMGASYPQVLIAQRTMFQIRQHYIDALVELQQSAASLTGFLLAGGLDAPSLTPGRNVQHVQATTSMERNADQDALDTAGLIEY